MVTIPRTVTIQLQFSTVHEFGLKNSYRTNILKRCQGSHWGGWAWRGHPSGEDDHRWKPLLEDDLWWKTTFSKRQPPVEDDLWWKMTFGGRQPSVENKLWWKTTFGWRQKLVEDDLSWGLLPLTVTKELSPNWNCYQLSQPEIEFFFVEKCMRHCACTHLKKRRHF